MADHSRRGAFKLAGGGVLAGLLAPFALKTPTPGAVPAFIPPKLSDLGSAGISRNLGDIAAVKDVLSRQHALQKVLNALYERRHNSRVTPLDFDIAGLKSVQPWAQNMMQVARNKDQDDLINKVRKLIGNESYDDDPLSIDHSDMPFWKRV